MIGCTPEGSLQAMADAGCISCVDRGHADGRERRLVLDRQASRAPPRPDLSRISGSAL
jgi:hypothetical protein